MESYDHIETPLQDNELNDKDYPKYGYLDKEEQIGPELSLIVVCTLTVYVVCNI